MDQPSRGPRTGPDPKPRRGPAAPGLRDPFPAELEWLEQRLESSMAAGSGADIYEPCVWHCACFLVHGS